MDRISNNFMNSLRSDKTPSKSGQKSKNNTPSPYPQRNHLSNSGNNTKRRTLTQIGTQSQKVGNKTQRYSINQLNKSVSPQASQAHSFGVDKVIQQKQSTIGNDYMKIFNMDNIVNAQPIQNKNFNQNYKQDQPLCEQNFNKNIDVSPNQYFSSNTFSRNAEQEQEKGFQNQLQQKQRTSSISYTNNLFAQQKRDEQNPFFKQDAPINSANVSSIQQKSATCIQDGSQFFRNKYQQEKLFQGAEKNNQSSSEMTVEFEANRNENNNFFAANQKQQNSESIISTNQNKNSMFEEKSQNEQSNNMANIFSIKPMGQNFIQNQNTGLILQEKSINPQASLDSRYQISQVIQQKDPLISQVHIKQPSNLRDLRQRHKQMKSESGDKSFSLQSNILDKIKDFNDKMKNQSRKTQDEFKSENSNKYQQEKPKSNSKMLADDTESQLSAATINDENKTLDDSLIQNLVSDQSQGVIQMCQNSNNCSQSEPLNILKESRIKYLTTKLDMIQESNTSKRSFVSGAFFQSQVEQKDKENIFGIDMNQNSQNYQKNFNIFGNQMNDIQATRKNLFGKYDYKEESENFEDHGYQNENLNQNKQSQFLFDSSDEQCSDNQIIQKGKLSQNNQSHKKIQSGQDISLEGRQNMTNSILDKAFIGDITAVYSEKKSNQLIREEKEALSQVINQNQILNSIENDIFSNNQDSIGFSQKDQQLKRLDQMGCSDISPIQSQVQVKSSNSGSKKDNDQLIDEIGQAPRNSLSLVNEFEILQIQNMNSQSQDKQGQNTTIPDKNQVLMLNSQYNENSHFPNSQNQSNKIDSSNSQLNENLLKDEIQTPFIQQKLKNFLEDIGYYNDEKKKHQINEIMSKVTLGLVIDKANASKQQYTLEDKTSNQPENKSPYLQEYKSNRISIGQNSEYLSCQSRFSNQTINDFPANSSPQTKNHKMITYDQSVVQNPVQIKEDLASEHITDNSNKAAQDQEQIENKHFEQLKKEVEFLYKSCKGKDEAEKNITSKIFNDVLYPQLGYKSVLEAFKEAINRAREMKFFTKQNKKEFNDLFTQINQGQDISENEINQNQQTQEKEDQINNTQDQKSNKPSSSRGLRRKMPTRGNKKKKESQSQLEISNASSECISESENEQSNSIDSDIDNAKNKGKSKANKLNKNKKLKKI
ncbi:hypothetical protein TTHERM_00932010 (macronuclear) [Tetrahymena thermophila SB210]|uniref:Uncharacterized protein n=1 Tax=Tetrahymena thermophila (strain SB210) TaxID=312017 RepID=I7M9G2_TETTS|nr:hypothetical protein TTHERM_00932010 [Tetrahymena thermophila SB210]EAS01611.2 hypothetical protein TTHERM_00932010 [Tetrahymena thermophila SB210]|eukprot:XP_001021856.2 hypothetical protein TTHERM_00932010 [Tetrahymena thermophila SB210]